MSEPVLIMAAPNGARRGKADHPALPVTIPETVETAVRCRAAAAAALHLHIRDGEGRHLLDAGVYAEAIAAVEAALAGDIAIQVTTEAVGRYSPADQMALVRDLQPKAVSIAVREIFADGEAEPGRFFAWTAEAGVAVQHIVYDVDDIRRFADYHRRGLILSDAAPRLILVVGRYTEGQESTPADLQPLIDGLAEIDGPSPVRMCCAFGRGETETLAAAAASGGHVRVGFENSLWHADGSVAADNAERVAALAEVVRGQGRQPADVAEARAILGIG